MGAFEYTVGAVIYISPDGLCENHSPCYSRIQDGFEWEGCTTYTIRVETGAYDEDLVLNRHKRIEVDGGWDKTFTTRSATSSIKSLQILDGTISSWNLVIQ